MDFYVKLGIVLIFIIFLYTFSSIMFSGTIGIIIGYYFKEKISKGIDLVMDSIAKKFGGTS